MYTRYSVIQKISKDSRVEVYTAERENLNWTFEHRRKPSNKENKDIFPFVITNCLEISCRNPGAETKCYRTTNDLIHFSDDYGVPEGFVICILSPQNYVPTMIKFKEKTNIPIYQHSYINENPGYVQIYSNRITKQSGIVLMTTHNTNFGFKADFKPCNTEFPSNLQLGASDTFEASIKLSSSSVEYLTQEDIQNYLHDIHQDIAEELLISINELVNLIKHDSDNSQKYSTIKDKIGTIVKGIVAGGSGIVTITDSVLNHGFAYNFLQTIFSYFSK